MATKATRNQEKYDKEHIVKYYLKLNKEYDKDIIDKIEKTAEQDNLSKQGTIKKLLRGE